MSNSPEAAEQLRVAEIYASIQGESTLAGLPCVFVRLAGCDLHCGWCDTVWAWDRGCGEPLRPDQVLPRVLEQGLGLVEVTGGEPLEQPASIPLMQALLRAGQRVMLETNGAQDISGVPTSVHVVLDLKAPSSGVTDRMRWENLDQLGPKAEIKIVLGDEEDYLWARELIRRRGLTERWPVLLSVVHGRLVPRDLASWMVRDRLPARLQLQLHKQIWSPDARGV